MTQYSNILEYSKKRKNYEIIKIKQTIMKKQKYFMSKNKSRENKQEESFSFIVNYYKDFHLFRQKCKINKIYFQPL